MSRGRLRELIVEADGGSRGNPGPAGYGAVVLDPVSGEALVETAEYIGVATNNVAEYKGLLAGLRAARELAPDASVRVRMDSKLVVEQMSGRWKIKHPDMKPLAAEAARIHPPGRVTYEWIPREHNKHADRLANEAMDAGRQGRQWRPSASRAALDAGAARVVGDATAGAARARAALARTAEPAGPEAAGRAPQPAPAPGATTGPAPGAAAPAPVVEPAPAGGPVPAGEPTPSATAPAPSAADDGAAATPATPPVGWAAPADLGTPATFVLLRHGETALTPEKRFSGSGGGDPELSPAGRRQAEAAAAALAARGTVQEVVSSPLLRCRQTALTVAGRLGLDVRIDDGLRETDFGAWEGLTFAEVRERYPDELDAWLASPKAAPPGGESFAAVSRRVAAARDRLTERHAGRTVLLVTHVTPIKTLVRLALGAPPEALFRMELSAASLSAVAYYRDGNASVRLLNDTSHLR
ncbi:bifunctional RNase H/acid phosphatase [Streptomyces sudanensis]|uniref:bifunctional RNase H/acid phosphatase n=1 Tax=Streptomyces sudanensis TaxID=436397 RepID=UPI0020CDF528|nr:bifunctional RNase H/acid phosphatase [Streptomyces sudanensis]MCP9959182.1 bifunctional RNase H/acid phosphatase [Streptomyces sudanensis]MCQ0000357.1 bifunctional RNase H/acid phosphatase [Streptomyces sudanensis]